MHIERMTFTIALFIFTFSFIPAAGTQSAASGGAQTESQSEKQAPQGAAPSPAQDQLPPELRPGHPLNPEDVDVLTGKRDRQLAAAQRANAPVLASPYGEFGYYGDYFWMNGRLGETWDIPMLPLPRISNPFFFGSGSLRGRRGRGFGGRR